VRARVRDRVAARVPLGVRRFDGGQRRRARRVHRRARRRGRVPRSASR
jgi:hypothetical protein